MDNEVSHVTDWCGNSWLW